MDSNDKSRGMTPEEVNGRKKTRFLRVLLDNGGFKEQAIKECHTSRRWFNEQLELDEEFALAVQTIVDVTNEQMVVEARRRALGYKEPIVYQGKIQGQYTNKDGEIVGPEHPEAVLTPAFVTKFSDNLLMFLIKGRMPEYRDGPGGKKAVDIPDDELNDAIRKYLARKVGKKADLGEVSEAVN
jgi:hypothetical protein